MSYVPRSPEETVLYQMLQGHLESLLEHGRDLPAYVERELRDHLRCGIFAHGFARVRCDGCRTEQLLPFS